MKFIGIPDLETLPKGYHLKGTKKIDIDKEKEKREKEKGARVRGRKAQGNRSGERKR